MDKTINSSIKFYRVKKRNSLIKMQKKCSKCKGSIQVKYVNAKKAFSKKNNWGYWTEKEQDWGIYFCSNCLKRWYCENFEEFSQQVTNPKKIAGFRHYMATGIL